MKFTKRFVITAIASCVLALSAMAGGPQRKDQKPPPKPPQEVPKKDKPPPPPKNSGNDKGGKDGKKGKPKDYVLSAHPAAVTDSIFFDELDGAAHDR